MGLGVTPALLRSERRLQPVDDMTGHGLANAFPRECMVARVHLVEREMAAEVDLWIGVEDLFAVVVAVLWAAGEDRRMS